MGKERQHVDMMGTGREQANIDKEQVGMDKEQVDMGKWPSGYDEVGKGVGWLVCLCNGKDGVPE